MSGRITASSHSLDLNAPELSLQINDLSYQKKGWKSIKRTLLCLRCGIGQEIIIYISKVIFRHKCFRKLFIRQYKAINTLIFKKSFKSLLPSLDKILNNSSPNKWGAFNARLKNTDFFKNVLNLNLHSQNGGYLYGK